MKCNNKSVAVLIDELITTNIKCYMAQENIVKNTNDLEVAESARLAQTLNKRRCQLIQALDGLLDGENLSITDKSY